MIPRKNPEDYHLVAKIRGFEWLGPTVSNVSTKTWWKCSRDHKWKTRYYSIKQGRGCPYCAGKARKVPADYHAIAKENSIEWLGPFPDTIMGRTNWKCLEEHIWTTSYNRIQQGRGCPYCYGNVRKISADYYKLAEARKIKWLGPVPANGSITKTWWECQKGHKWEATHNKIQQGRGCPDCHLERKLKKPDDYHSLAEKRGFGWLGMFPQTTRHKTQWQCSRSHKWIASYSSLQQGAGCPYCCGNAPKNSEDYHELANKRNFKWLGPLPAGVTTPTRWECAENHSWKASYNSISSSGSGCPKCIDLVNGQQVSNIQRCLCKMVGGELNFPHSSYRIDVALPDEKIAIEYDSWYWHGNRLENDRQRDQDLLNAGWRILHVRSNNKLPTKAQLDNAITQLQSGKDNIEIVLNDWGHGPIFTGFT